MGGDHKCPVCQATFTRPQHVARHMRSHTGDRPYKCLYCGDQFARSDLLSRHVNKCHSNEKPLHPANARRKGSAALRATTSKQACDQCVQSSLPCDGANPCSKCVQRKCRCTFVKFHRQTAPTGPGHAPPPLPSSSAPLPDSPSARLRTSLPPSPPHPHVPTAFFPGHDQHPAPTSTSSLGALYAENFGFPAVYPPRIDHTASLPSDPPIDYSSRYRAHAAELAHRNPSNPPSYQRQAIYPPHTTSSWTGWDQGIVQDPQDMRFLSHDQASNGGDYAPSPVMGSYPLSVLVHRRQSLEYSGSESGASVSESPSVSSSSRSSSVHLPLSLPDHDVQMAAPFQPSRTDPSFQPPSLRTQDIRPSTSPTSPASVGPIPLQHAHSQPPLQGDGNASFSSAFGLMSLDDPNVLAGLTADAAPFFSNAAMGLEAGMDPDATPMPMTLTQSQPAPFHDDNSKLHAAGMRRATTTQPPSQWSPVQLLPGLSRERDKEKDTRELREFWKEYIRSPGALADTPGGYRRSRVNSLPSKTPLAGPGVMGSQGYWYPYAPGQLQSPGTTPIAMVLPRRPSTGTGVSAAGQGEGQGQGPARHLHGSAEDLRSYEAAVLARKAPTNLSLNPRRRGTVAATSGSGSSSSMFARGGSASVGASPTIAPFMPASVRGALNKNRINEGVVAEKDGDGRWGDAMETEATTTTTTTTVPASSVSSSLANVFGTSQGPDTDSMSFRRGSVSRESSVVSESSDMSGDGAGSLESMRPSFKRLPSQTLEPLNAKRAQLNDPRVDSDDGSPDSEAARQARAGRLSGLSLAERRRLAGGKLAVAGNFELDLGGLDKF